jgi:hypothetical protein
MKILDRDQRERQPEGDYKSRSDRPTRSGSVRQDTLSLFLNTQADFEVLLIP